MKRPPASGEVSRRRLARWQRERRQRRFTLAFLSAAILLVLAIPAFGYYQTQVAPYREPVLKVNHTVFNMGYYIKLLRMQKLQEGANFNAAVAPQSLLLSLEEDELLRQAAPRLKISVAEEEVDRGLRRLALGEDNAQDPAAEGRFKEEYRQLLNLFQLSDQEFRELVRADLRREKLREQLSVEVPTLAEQVHLNAILLKSQERAEEVLKRLRGGEDFAAVAREVSQDPTRTEGGDLGWVPRGVYTYLDEVVFNLKVGEVSEPLSALEGYHILMVSEKAAAREIEAEDREVLKDRALERWLEEERKANEAGIAWFWNDRKYSFALKKVQEYEPPQS